MWAEVLWPVAFVLGMWLFGREIARGLAAHGLHLGSRIGGSAWTPLELFPKPPKEGLPVDEEEDEEDPIEGIDMSLLDRDEGNEVWWAVENYKSSDHREEALEKFAAYRAISKQRAEG